MMPLLAEIDWNSLLENRDFGTIAFLALLAILGVTVLVGTYWQKTLHARLKERMIERGFTAEEIISVINAGEGRAAGRKAPTRVNDSASQPDRLKTPTN